MKEASAKDSNRLPYHYNLIFHWTPWWCVTW